MRARAHPPVAGASGPYQLMPPLAPEDFATLKADVAARGVQVPVEVDEAGNLLDGHHRVQAWTELRAEGHRLPDYPRVVRRFSSEEDRIHHVLALNLARRHLSPADRAQVIGDLRARRLSIRRIAGELGVGYGTVRRALQVFNTEHLAGEPHGSPERVTGADGKTYRTARPAPSIPVKGRRDQARAQDALEALGEEAPAKLMELSRAEQLGRQANLQRLRAIEPARVTGPGLELVLGDFRDLDLAPASVDAIICDPPYTDAFLPLWSDLSAFAARVLKPGRLLVAYAGKHALPDLMGRLGERLEYVWTGTTALPGHHSTFRASMVRTRWRPWLVYSAGPYRPRGWIDDALKAEGRGDKDPSDHPWRQTLGPFRRLVEMVSRPGELVLDPFLGQGTTALAAVVQGRRFLGADVDPAALALARELLEANAYAGAPAG